MSNTTESTVELSPIRIALSVRYGFIIYPISGQILQKVLTDKGYTLSKMAIPELPVGVLSLEMDGQLATRETTRVSVLTDRQVITVSSGTIQELISSFNELEEGLTNELEEDLESKALFYETILRFQAKTGQNPMETLSRFQKLPPFPAMSRILEYDVAPLNVRVSPVNRELGSSDWFEFTIEPLVPRSKTTYHVQSIFRNAKKKSVTNHIQLIEKIIKDSLRELETH